MDLHPVPQVLQAKLTVNTPGDKYEQEADAIAGKVMDMPGNTPLQQTPISPAITYGIQTKGESMPDAVSPSLDHSVAASQGKGSRMDSDTRAFMSGRFGADFANVKIHTDSEAAEMNRELDARAFTVGNDIYFNAGEYRPGWETGRRLLAHELAHVVQQNGSNNRGNVIRRQSITVDNAKDKAEENAVKRTMIDAERMANKAQVEIGGDNGSLYNTWFDKNYHADRKKDGMPENNRFDFVKKGWVKIFSIFKSRHIIVDCSTRALAEYAHVFPKDKFYKIFLGKDFWGATLSGRDSKPGAILHELAHEEVYTDDKGYGEANARRFAATDPDKAVNNSDNWEYFAEDA